VADRPRYIEEHICAEGCCYTETDHTAFEAHMTCDVMRAVEFQLYGYMWAQVLGGREVFNIVKKALAGINTCINKLMIVKVLGSRMSGDMCTSLGNGFTNLMLMLFVCSEHKVHCVGVVEGDDGLFRIDTKDLKIIQADDFMKLGFEIKLAVRATIGESSFCGLMYGSSYENVRDPLEVLCRFGWTKSPRRFGGPRVMAGLLRAKALSLAYELPGCPILRNLAIAALRVTSVKPFTSPTYADAVKALLLQPGVKPLYEGSWRERQIFGTGTTDVLSPEIAGRLLILFHWM